MRRGDEFTRVTRRGRRAGRPLVTVHMLGGHAPQDRARVGFVVGRSVGNAVIRNRVRRRLRHLMRQRLQCLPGAAGVVVRANRTSAEATFHDLGGDLDRALARLLDRRPHEAPTRGRG